MQPRNHVSPQAASGATGAMRASSHVTHVFTGAQQDGPEEGSEFRVIEHPFPL